jgi:hypothetical protein
MDRVGLHGNAEAAHAAAEALEIGAHARADEGVDRGRRHALELAEFGEDLRTTR